MLANSVMMQCLLIHKHTQFRLQAAVWAVNDVGEIPHAPCTPHRNSRGQSLSFNMRCCRCRGGGGGGLFLLDTTAAARVSKRLRSEDVLPMSCRGHPESEDESPTSLDERPNLEVVSSMSYNERLNSKQAAPILRSECLVSEPVSMLPRNERCWAWERLRSILRDWSAVHSLRAVHQVVTLVNGPERMPLINLWK